jgi:seryl-tRNA synthetase
MTEPMTEERKAEIGELSMHSKDIDAFKHATTDLYNETKRLEGELKKKEDDIQSLCYLLQMIHDKVPHGPGIHSVIRETIAKYKKVN